MHAYTFQNPSSYKANEKSKNQTKALCTKFKSISKTYNPVMHPKHMEDKARNDQLHAVLFAAGMAVVIACLERAVVVSIFKQWHMWVFLALNLLLIAILFTSTHPPRSSSNPPPKSQETDGTRKIQPPPPPAANQNAINDGEDELKLSNEARDESIFEDNEEEDGEDEKSSSLLSNEELNEKVEAFISRFRQQYLVSEVKISRARSENVCRSGSGVFSKTINSLSPVSRRRV